MAKPLTSEAALTVFSALMILGALGVVIYLYRVNAFIPALTPQSKQYNVGVIENELRKPADQNIFVHTTKLRQPSEAQEQQANYQQQELGKANLSQLGQ